MDYHMLADYLFPDIRKTPQDLELLFPPRNLQEGAKVTRIAPSPTGFMHLGNLYGAIADERIAHQSNGVFFLRIEDTDKKREIDGGVETIVNVFDYYGLKFDEGAVSGGNNGAYGPYYQQQRKEIYQICAKWLVQQGLAYPCFLAAEELTEMREKQADKKEDFGCYGNYAIFRGASFSDVKKRVEKGEKFVLRFLSGGNSANKVKIDDLIRGKIELTENIQDVVILKKDGVPTYHFAHVVDDHFMRTTHVVRGEEWLATLPIHIQLFTAMGWKIPKYLHTAHLMKMEGGSKRKLSKRKDPELSLGFYKQNGYSVAVLKEYMMLLLNSNFEDWRRANLDLPLEDFQFSIKKMGTSGALFDIDKLNDVSRGVISRMSSQEVYSELLAWAEEFDKPFGRLLSRNPDYSKTILAIGRGGKKPRKDITEWSGAKEYLGFFFDEIFAKDSTLPENVKPEMAKRILTEYQNIYISTDDPATWFDKIKGLAEKIGYTSDMKAYKASPSSFAGNVGDVSMVIRIAVTGRQTSPDLREVMSILGKENVIKRLQVAAEE